MARALTNDENRYNIAIYTTNSYSMILVQKMSMYYGEK